MCNKYIFWLSLATTIAVNFADSYGQSYVPLKKFGRDTDAYLYWNFEANKQLFHNKTVAETLGKVEITYQYFGELATSWSVGVGRTLHIVFHYNEHTPQPRPPGSKKVIRALNFILTKPLDHSIIDTIVSKNKGHFQEKLQAYFRTLTVDSVQLAFYR